MRYIDFNGNRIETVSRQDKLLQMLYTHRLGRLLIQPMTYPAVSRGAGWLCNSRLSKLYIARFVKRNHIDMENYESQTYHSFNDFFTRKIKNNARPVQGANVSLISPADGKVSVYPITQNSRFRIKHTEYTVESLLHNNKLAESYQNGYLILIRLTVQDYHRYCYCANGYKGNNNQIRGVFHTIHPIANVYFPVYKENTRSYTLIQSQHFGNIVQMEVGALCVGRIVNHHESKQVYRGEEKGYFEFGGSTVVLLIESNRVQINASLLTDTAKGYETCIRMGEVLGIACGE